MRRIVWSAMTVISVVSLVVVFGAALWPAPSIPSYEAVRESYLSSDVDVLDREGRRLSRVRRDFDSRRLMWQPLKSLPSWVIEDLIHSEDRGFYRHGGVDLGALIAAAWQRTRFGSSRGGSTIQMQLSRLLNPALAGSDLWTKFLQMKVALEIGRTWTRDEVLEAYLNLAPFRGESRGIEAAAWNEFRVEASRLSRPESAWLMALLRGPNADRRIVLRRACDLRPDRCDEMTALEGRRSQMDRAHAPRERALHFSYRASSALRGGSLATHIDANLQDFAEKSVHRRLREIEKQNVKDAAVLVLDNKTGQIITYVGSSGGLSEAPEVDGVKAVRQVGSTLKPFLYAVAFQKGLIEPESWIEDSPIDLTFPSGVYRPGNHDREFRGWVRVREALGSSLNVPAVKLLSMMPIPEFWQILKDLGFEGLRSPDDYGPALALGVADMSLGELTNAYRALANGGIYRPISWPGQQEEKLERRVFAESAVAMVTDVLSRSENRVLGFGVAGSTLAPAFRTAFKTGTSKDMRDNWCVGWTKDFTIGVWVGNFDGQPMRDVSGLSGAAPIWMDVASELHRRSPQDLPQGPMTHPVVEGPVRAKRPRILYPKDGLILARDPDIPVRRQKVPLVNDPAGRQDLSWFINGEFFSRAREESLWTPVRGRHRIELSDGKNVFEKVEIVVK